MRVVLEHVRADPLPNLTEIHCQQDEVTAVTAALRALTNKSFLPLDVCGEHVIFVTADLTMEEADALLICLRNWKLRPEQITRAKLQSAQVLERFWQQLEARQSIHNLEREMGLSAFDYADTEAGD